MSKKRWENMGKTIRKEEKISKINTHTLTHNI